MGFSLASANQRLTLKQCWYKKREHQLVENYSGPQRLKARRQRKSQLSFCFVGSLCFFQLFCFCFFIKDYKVIQRWGEKMLLWIIQRTGHEGKKKRAELQKTPKAGRKTTDPTPADVEIVASPSQDGDTFAGATAPPTGHSWLFFFLTSLSPVCFHVEEFSDPAEQSGSVERRRSYG